MAKCGVWCLGLATHVAILLLLPIKSLWVADVGLDTPLRTGEDETHWHSLIWKTWAPGKDTGDAAYVWDRRPVGKGEEGLKAVLAEIAKLPTGARVFVQPLLGAAHLPGEQRYPFDLKALKDHMTQHGVLFEWIKV